MWLIQDMTEISKEYRETKMRKPKYKWRQGTNDYQKYYDVYEGDDYLCVFANNSDPGIWYGCYNNTMILNKTKNDRIRKRDGVPKECSPYELRTLFVLTSADPEYMMKKVESCYARKCMEISQ